MLKNLIDFPLSAKLIMAKSFNMRKCLSLFFSVLFLEVFAQNYKTLNDLPYYDLKTRNSDSYIKERCLLDFYYPTDKKDFYTVIWLHGGGLTYGHKEIPEGLKNQGIAVVAVNYRLSPKAVAPAYLNDVAAACAWVFQNIGKYGGDPRKIVIAGHSAGGYLAAMIGLDDSYLKKYNIDSDSFAEIASFSGQMFTHYTIKQERKIPTERLLVDEFAPSFWVKKNSPKILLTTGGRTTDLEGRYAENIMMLSMFKQSKNDKVKFYELEGFDHSNMPLPSYILLLEDIRKAENEDRR